MDLRETAAADALGSTRAEGLEPSKETLLLVEQWKRGKLSDADLEAAEHRIIEAATPRPAASR